MAIYRKSHLVQGKLTQASWLLKDEGIPWPRQARCWPGLAQAWKHPKNGHFSPFPCGFCSRI